MTGTEASRLANEYRAIAPFYMKHNYAARMTEILAELRQNGWRRLAELIEEECT